MNVRELLQYEIWSKETSRKILRPIGKLLKHAAIVLGVLVVLLGSVFAVEFYWLTSGERSAGKEALAKIDELEGLIDCNCDRFAVVDDEAKAATELARQKARTLRDYMIVGDLRFYLSEVTQDQADDLREAQLKTFVLQRHLQWQSDPELEREGRTVRIQVLSIFRSALHKELD